MDFYYSTQFNDKCLDNTCLLLWKKSLLVLLLLGKSSSHMSNFAHAYFNQSFYEVHTSVCIHPRWRLIELKPASQSNSAKSWVVECDTFCLLQVQNRCIEWKLTKKVVSYRTVSCCIVLYCAVSYRIILYHIASHRIPLCCIVLHRIARYRIVPNCATSLRTTSQAKYKPLLI